MHVQTYSFGQTDKQTDGEIRRKRERKIEVSLGSKERKINNSNLLRPGN